MAGLLWLQLRLMVWKTFTLQSRRPIAAAAGFLLPILLMGALAALRAIIPTTPNCFQTCADTNLDATATSLITAVNSPEFSGRSPTRRDTVYYYPDNAVTRRIMETASCLAFTPPSSGQQSQVFRVEGRETETSLASAMSQSGSRGLAGVVFNDMSTSETMLPASISYTLRLLTAHSGQARSRVATWLTSVRESAFFGPGIPEGVNHRRLTEPLMYVIDQAFTRLQIEMAPPRPSGQSVPLCRQPTQCTGLRLFQQDSVVPLMATQVQCAFRSGFFSPQPDTVLASNLCCNLSLQNSNTCSCNKTVAMPNSADSPDTFRSNPTVNGTRLGDNVSCTCALDQLSQSCSCTVNGRRNPFIQLVCPPPHLMQRLDIFRSCCGRCENSSFLTTQQFAGNQGLLPILTRSMPTQEFTPDVFVSIGATLFPIIFVLTFLQTVYIVTQELILEKRARLKESLRMMGCRNWILWLSWFLNYFIQYIIMAMLLAVAVKFGNIAADADFFVLTFFFLLYLLALLFYCFFCSTLFSNPTAGALAAVLGFLGSTVPIFIFSATTTTDGMLKTGFCSPFFINSCAGYGMGYVLQLQGRNTALTFSNMSSQLDSADTFTLAIVYGMLISHIFFFGFATWYIEAVFPGEFGVPKPFYFFLEPSYWLGNTSSSEKINDVEMKLLRGADDTRIDPTAFEEEPTGLHFGIRIQNLQKIFKSAQGTKVAVDGLTLNMVEGQITALLGHNGAGKTTTMSMLTGLYNPTGGDALINGKSILRDMDEIRNSLGLCPQHNVLWDKLTVKEHLELFASLKGVTGPALNTCVNEMVKDLKLSDKLNWRASTLSGGMKRKLSVGIALVGGSRVVIFDEPTAGMDPYARRATWDLLIKNKKDRTILLTTHYMDEADLLGDRIAIMADGDCKCCGSSLFLKSRYGVGYHLTVSKAADCVEDTVSRFVLDHIPTGKLVSSVGAEMAFILPSEATVQFPKMFEAMESNKDSLGVANFGLSVTTMEEVFIRVGQIAEEAEAAKKAADAGESAAKESESKKRLASSSADGELVTGYSLWLQRMKALFIKRMIIASRSLFVLFIQIVIPVVCLAGAMAILLGPSSSGRSSESFLAFGTPYFLRGSATSVNYRFADFRRPTDVKYNFTTGLNNLAGSDRAVNTETITPAVDRVLSGQDTTDCCRNKYLMLTETCLRQIVENRELCAGSTTFGYTHCARCLDSGTIFRKGANSTFRGFQDGPAWGSCGARDSGGSSRACPALPLDLQSSYSGYLSQHLLQSGSLSGAHRDNFPALFSLHTMSVKDNQAYNFSDLHQRDTPLPCLATTDRLLGAATPPAMIYRTTSRASSCNQLIGRYDNESSYARVWSWGQNLHAGPSALNVFSNAYLETLLREHAGTNGGGDWQFGTYGITTGFLPVRAGEDQVRANAANGNSLTFVIIFILGYCFMLGSFAILPLEEKKNKARHIQFVSGVGTASYWISNFIADALTSLVTFILLMIVLVAFNDKTFNAIRDPAASILFGGGLASITMAYLGSLMFQTPVLCFAFLIVSMFILGLGGSVATFVLGVSFLQAEKLIVYRIFCAFPPFSVANALIDLFVNENTLELCRQTFAALNTTGTNMTIETCYRQFNASTDPTAYEEKAIGYNIAITYSLAFVCLFLVIVIEQGWLARPFAFFFAVNKNGQSTSDEDNDVKDERRKVWEIDPGDPSVALVARDLTKSFPGRLSRPSSDHICLSIAKGECFGLLGVNGAGKTTTFSMLTGEVSPSEGDAFIMGYSIRNQLAEVQQRVGFCPQFDALLEKMTAYELLTMFARLRGLPEGSIKGVVDNLVNELDLKKWANRLCGTYSGGNKRKLSTAIALVGDPPVIFLDEPTAGMDPAARRFLWDFLTKVLYSGRSIVLTSHSMEECEALCTRLAIMVNGQFKCLGSLQHIKGKFGKGFNLTTKVRPPLDESGQPSTDQAPDTTALKNLVATSFPKHEIEDEHFGQVQFRIEEDKESGVTWSSIFRVMESNRESLGIIDYQLSQTTLEQVFLKFAKKQSLEENQ